MRRSLAAQYPRSCESCCRLACQMPDFCKHDEYKHDQKADRTQPFLDDVGLERQWPNDTMQFLYNK